MSTKDPSRNHEITKKKEYLVQYTARDVALYAVAVGLGATTQSYASDLPYVWEDHDSFAVVPTWVTTLLFWAKRDNPFSGNGILPVFPPPVMTDIGILPKYCLRRTHDDDDDDEGDVESILSGLPILHTWTSIHWKKPLAVPGSSSRPTVSYKLRHGFVAVEPKSVGTFVTSQTDIWSDPWSAGDQIVGDEPPEAICTVQSTALILGLDPESVKPWKSNDQNDSWYRLHSDGFTSTSVDHASTIIMKQESPDYTEEVTIHSNTALLYRLASGDSNAIHVDPSANPFGGANNDYSDKSPQGCLLHGLATLGIVARVILQQQQQEQNANHATTWRHLQAKFTQPVLVGDTIQVQLWKRCYPLSTSNAYQKDVGRYQTHYFFRVRNGAGKVALDCGMAILVGGTTDSTRDTNNIGPLPSKL